MVMYMAHAVLSPLNVDRRVSSEKMKRGAIVAPLASRVWKRLSDVSMSPLYW